MNHKPKIVTNAGYALNIAQQRRLDNAKDRAAFKKKLDRKRDRDRETVKGVFHYHECPGGFLEFYFRGYPGDPIMKYELWDGQMYEIPLGVAKHLNKNVAYKVHKRQLGPDGNYTVKVGKRVKRCSFQSLDYTEAIREEHYEDHDQNTILPTPDTISQV